VRDARYKADLESLEKKFNEHTADLNLKNSANLQDLEERYEYKFQE
jgi:hypothetical protein